MYCRFTPAIYYIGRCVNVWLGRTLCLRLLMSSVLGWFREYRGWFTYKLLKRYMSTGRVSTGLWTRWRHIDNVVTYMITRKVRLNYLRIYKLINYLHIVFFILLDVKNICIFYITLSSWKCTTFLKIFNKTELSTIYIIVPYFWVDNLRKIS